MGPSTSASAMHFKKAKGGGPGARGKGALLLLLTLCALLFAPLSQAELIDRVVAFVDDRAITLSELRETFEKTGKIQPGSSMGEVLNTMINRMLLVSEAKRLKMEAGTDDELLKEYIELKVKALIRLKEEELEDFYRKNEQEFKGAPYETVRTRIEEYLTEKEVNRLLKQHIAELKAKAYVKIVMEELVQEHRP